MCDRYSCEMFLSICRKGKLCNCKKDSFKRKMFKIKRQMFQSKMRNKKIKLSLYG